MAKHDLSEAEAITLFHTRWWEGRSARELATFQLFTERLCMPFDVFHRAVVEALGRPVFTHEFACADSLKAELLGEKSAPSFEEVLLLIPAEKLVIVRSP